MMRAMTQAERDLDRLKELERDGTLVSQSVQRRTLAREIFGAVHAIWTNDAILGRYTINPGRYVILGDRSSNGGETVAKISHGE